MTIRQIALLRLEQWVDDRGCHLYLWVTDYYAGHVAEILGAWNFEPKAWLVWVKPRIGMGNYFRHQHEFCVFAVRGRLRLRRRDASTVFSGPITIHSEKPESFYSLVESCSPGPYLDVFARRRRAGWDAFGDELSNSMPYQQRLYGTNESDIVNGG